MIVCRSPTCAACGDAPTVTASTLPSFDYEGFTGHAAGDSAPTMALLEPRDRLTADHLAERLAADADIRPLLLDVRPVDQFAMCHLPGASDFKLHADSVLLQLCFSPRFCGSIGCIAA